MNDRFIVGLIVENHHGVLDRIAGLYAKRGYNIDSLSVGETEDPTLSRMTIVSKGDEYIKKQVVRQLNKLFDVRRAVLLEEDETISVEHLLIKIKINGEGNSHIAALINAYGGKIMDLGEHFITADLTGESVKIDEFISKVKGYGIKELCRSGRLALLKGEESALGSHTNK